MVNQCAAIALHKPTTFSDARPDRVLAEAGDDGERPLTLESERLGLLAGRASSVAGDCRMENWIASNLDIDAAVPLSPRNLWTRIIEGLPGLKRDPRRRSSDRAPETAAEGWCRFHVAYKRGITLVRLVDSALLKEPMIQELVCELIDLIEAGNPRIVLNCARVERLASLALMGVNEAAARCALGDGGSLKVCGLRPELAAIFPMAGMRRHVESYPDEFSAITSPWPPASGPRPLPVEVLSALLTAADIRPVCGGAPAEPAEPSAPKSVPRTAHAQAAERTAAERTAATAAKEVWLSVRVGAAKGRRVAITSKRFVIGRDPSCNLRLGSPMISKFHAALELREQGLFLRDLGSTNGTILNGRPLRGREVEAQHGDRVQIGPVVLHISKGPPESEAGDVEEQVAGWLRGPDDGPQGDPGADMDTSVYPTSPASEPDQDNGPQIKHDVIQNVLVVTPMASALDDTDTIERLRAYLRALFDSQQPREVVINLEYAGHLSALAIGVLLAHHLRLDRAGGAMRVCQARARVMAVLHQVRFTMLVECHPTLDEAVISAWPDPARRESPADA
jgi:anti-anti-sigma factor